MKYIFLILMIFIGSILKAQYNPANFATNNKPYGSSQAFATDARTYYYETSTFTWRPYQNTTEVLLYLNLPKYRTGQFDIIVNTGGVLSGGLITGGINRVYYFKNGTADSNLVLKFPVQTVNGRIGDVVVGNADSIRGRTVDTTVASGSKNNYLLAYDSTNRKWKLTAPASSYSAGTGISIASNVISALNTTALWNANSLRGRSITTGNPSVGNTITWSGTEWQYSGLNGLDTAYLSNDTLYLVNTFDTIPVVIKTLYNADGAIPDGVGRTVTLGNGASLNVNGTTADINLQNSKANVLLTNTGLVLSSTGDNKRIDLVSGNPSYRGIRIFDDEDTTGLILQNNGDDFVANIVATDSAYTTTKAVKRLITDSSLTANNGLSKSGSNIVLGQDYGDGSNPAALSGYREIPIRNYALVLTGTGGVAGAQTQMYGSSVTIAGDSTNNATGAINIGDITNPGKYLELRGFPAYGSISYDGGNNIKVLPNGNTEIKRLYVTDSLNIGKVSTGLSTDSVLVKGTDGVVRKVAQGGLTGYIKNDTTITQNGGFKLGAGSKMKSDSLTIRNQVIGLSTSNNVSSSFFNVRDSLNNSLIEWRVAHSPVSAVYPFTNFFLGTGAGSAALPPTGSSLARSDYAIGDSALAYYTVGSNNLAIGARGQIYRKTGVANVTVGNFALDDDTAGVSNTAIGFDASQHTQGSFSTSLGAEALRTNLGVNSTIQTINQTVGIGYQAATPFSGDATSRDSATILGAKAAFLGQNIARGVLIGHSAGANQIVGRQKLYIANSNTTFPLIYGEFDNNILATPGKLGIGTKTPSTFLTVQSTASRIINPVATFTDSLGFPFIEIRANKTAQSSGSQYTNFFIGRGAGMSYSPPADNASYLSSYGIGDSTLAYCTTGDRNIAIGSRSQIARLRGAENVSVGWFTLNVDTINTRSTALGSQALRSAKADGATAVGALALNAGTTTNYISAVHSTAIGLQAAGSTPGNIRDSSVFVGAFAGNNTGSTRRTVLIGFNAGNGIAVGDDKLYIANSATTNPLIYGDFANNILATPGRFGIRTQNPGAFTLNVGGSVAINKDSIPLVASITSQDILLSDTANSGKLNRARPSTIFNAGLPSLTSGSVLFSNGTTISQDNSNFFWNNTTKRLGIGVNNPSYDLDITKSAAASSVWSSVTNSSSSGWAYFSTNASGSGLGLGSYGNTYSTSGSSVASTSRIYCSTSLYLDATDYRFYSGNVGIGLLTTTPTARLHLVAGTATASTAPLKFTAGTTLTSSESGAMETNSSNSLFYTNSSSRARVQVNYSVISNAASLSLDETYYHISFTGTTATYTLPALSVNLTGRYVIKNRGSGNITVNSNAGGNDIYNTSAVNTYSITPGQAIEFFNDGNFWNVE